jgi:hypothetical protein
MALLDEAIRGEAHFNPGMGAYLRGNFCDESGDAKCAIPAYRTALDQPEALAPAQRERAAARLKTLSLKAP